MLLGQGGYTFSLGFYAFGERLKSMGYPVSYWMPRRPDLVVADVLQKPNETIVLIGYSLGANATTWVASGWQGGKGLNAHGRKVDLLVAYDPTVNVYSTPLTSNVKRALLYQQTAWWFPTSWGFGRGVIEGSQVETIKVSMDHLAVQASEKLHLRTIAAIEKMK